MAGQRVTQYQCSIGEACRATVEHGLPPEGTLDGVPAGKLVIRARGGQWVEPRNVPQPPTLPFNRD